MLLSEKIYKLRKENGLSQENLATKLNVSRQAVSKWESGVIPDIDNIVNLARYFDCSIDYLLNDDIDSIDGSIKSDEDKNDNTFTENQKNRFSENLKINILLTLPILVILIMWIISKLVEVPITHQDYNTKNFYTGFSGFIDYYDLWGLFYICIAVWVIGVFMQLVWKVYIEPKKENIVIDRKMKGIYIIRFLLLICGATLFTYVILNPWKFSWTIQTIIALTLYFIVIASLSIIIRGRESK